MLIAEQQAAKSKSMAYIKSRVGKGPQKGLQFEYVDEDGLIVMKHKKEEVGKVVVPDSLRAYVLRTHHNVELAGHQGPKEPCNK